MKFPDFNASKADIEKDIVIELRMILANKNPISYFKVYERFGR
jgi:hypothetical protein